MCLFLYLVILGNLVFVCEKKKWFNIVSFRLKVYSSKYFFFNNFNLYLCSYMIERICFLFVKN